MKVSVIAFLSVLILGTACSSQNSKSSSSTSKQTQTTTMDTGLDTATFGGGCFWCTEAIFQQINGVEQVYSGYTGGTVEHPTYEQICTGTTGHAEVIQIVYQPSVVAYDTLLEVFWKTHDPTTLNRQGNDVGTQYRSVIFYHNEAQKEKALYYKQKLEEEGIYEQPIVTEISPISIVYKAENYHQNYYKANKDKNPYCSLVITPKVKKFEALFKTKMKP